jgi:hypothetical protein
MIPLICYGSFDALALTTPQRRRRETVVARPGDLGKERRRFLACCRCRRPGVPDARSRGRVEIRAQRNGACKKPTAVQGEPQKAGAASGTAPGLWSAFPRWYSALATLAVRSSAA